MTWILVLYIYAGPLAKGDGVSVTAIQMPTEAACNDSGRKAALLVKGSAKELRFLCLKGGAA
jgi:hypothetical protein